MERTGGETTATEPGTGVKETPAPWACIAFGPPEAWVEAESHDPGLAAKPDKHTTCLLWVRQVEAEAGQHFHQTAVRLETALAVQHQSQWQLNLDPRSQQLTLHWLRVVRGTQVIDQLRREHMRLIQRESQLERLVLDGNWTLLVVLEDVRPGDVIEAAYSYTTRHPIRPEGTETLFLVPPNLLVGRFRLSVRFTASRPGIAWRASADAPVRQEEELPEGRRRWTWAGSQLALREPEPNHPGNYLDYVWIQVSDLTDWQPLAGRIEEVWRATDDGTELGPLVGCARPEVVDEAAVQHVVQHLQDGFRYLSVDLESGGWVPAAPAAVARRRYGDCKDLAWMGAVLLRQWGVAARPILVGSGLRGQVAQMQPMSLLFNHAVLEVTVGVKTRWFDLTLRGQGGTFSSQPVGWFGCGLPVTAAATALQAQTGERPPGVYAIRETILLDSRPGEFSTVEHRLWTEGWQAENLRRTRLAQGAEEFAAERLKQAQRRYGKARRAGLLHWRDNRTHNTCELVESIEINDVLNRDESGKRAIFDVAPNVILQSFALPEDKPRRGPWDLPYPIEVRHEITVLARSMAVGNRQQRSWECPEFEASLDEPRRAGAWSKVARFTVLVPAVAADRTPAYRAKLEEFLRASSWRLYIPWGQARRPRGAGFGLLPVADAGVESYVSPARSKRVGPGAPAAESSKVTEGLKIHRPQRWRRSNPTIPRSVLRMLVPVAVVILLCLVRACARNLL